MCTSLFTKGFAAWPLELCSFSSTPKRAGEQTCPTEGGKPRACDINIHTRADPGSGWQSWQHPAAGSKHLLKGSTRLSQRSRLTRVSRRGTDPLWASATPDRTSCNQGSSQLRRTCKLLPSSKEAKDQNLAHHANVKAACRGSGFDGRACRGGTAASFTTESTAQGTRTHLTRLQGTTGASNAQATAGKVLL